MQLEFFDEAHEYRLDGVKLPSVTEVLGFGKDRSRIPRYTALFGSLVHKACEYDSQDDLDPDSLVAQYIDGKWCDPWPRVLAWREYRTKQRRRVTDCELRVWGDIDGLLYGATIDVVWGADPVVIDDLKTGQKRPAEHGPQVQAYARAYMQRTDKDVKSTGCVYLPAQGAAEREPYDSFAYYDQFRVALHRWYDAQRMHDEAMVPEGV